MKSRGSFRGFIAATMAFFGRFKWWGSHHYDDPHYRDTYHHQRSRAGTKLNRRGRRRISGHLPCIPGTGTYFDMLVRKFGRRQADKYQRCLIAKQPDLLPTPELLAATPDWAWRNG